MQQYVPKGETNYYYQIIVGDNYGALIMSRRRCPLA